MSDAASQNARMLASLMGQDVEVAAERLTRSVLITHASDPVSRSWAAEIAALLERTVRVCANPAAADLELVVGSAEARTAGPCLWAAIGAAEAVVASVPVTCGDTAPQPLFAAVAACPAAAAVLRSVIGSGSLPPVEDPLRIKAADVGMPTQLPELNLSGSVLVGAGAVAHGFLRALRHISAAGELELIDPKNVAAGILNRCLYLGPDDVGLSKAEALAARASSDFPNLRLIPRIEDFASYARRVGKVQQAIVTVDSRRARRSIQKHLPGEVVDASTTDARAVVVHSNRQPNQHACMACIYRHVREEHARERSIAEGLGVDLASVQQGYITFATANRIAASHPGTDPASLVGKSYDTLFRELCAAQALLTPEGRQVLAPFAFVSAFAGALLVVELLRRSVGTASTNYWQVDPWRGPIARTRRLRARDPGCEFCSLPDVEQVARTMWG